MIGRARVTLPPGSFLQATAAGEQTLARLVEDHIGDAKLVADLFCGVGPFALRLAERARIMAFDADAGAIAALKQATNMTSGLKPIEAETRDLFRRPLVAQELKRVDALVFDPPRQGAEAQARELAKSTVATVVAVSCNPATFARDARLLARWRLSAEVGNAGGSVPAFRPCRDRRAADAVIRSARSAPASRRAATRPAPVPGRAPFPVRRAAPSSRPPCGNAHNARP